MKTAEQRKHIILKQIEQGGSVNVFELATALGVSDMTIRRDLKELEKINLIRRTHGGAVSSQGRSYEPPLVLRSNENKPIKQLLGRYAAKMVMEGESIALDIGSTVYEIAVNLKRTRNITVVTPSIPIANLFCDRSDVRLILPGGVVRPGELSMIGEYAQRNLKSLFVDKLFLAVGAIDSMSGLTEYNIDDTAIKETMIKNSKEIILVVDSSKFEKIAFAFIAPLSILTHLITDAKPPEKLLENIKNSDVKVHIVTEEGSSIF